MKSPLQLDHWNQAKQPSYDWNDRHGFDIRCSGYTKTCIGYAPAFHGYINQSNGRVMIFDTAEEVGQLLGGN